MVQADYIGTFVEADETNTDNALNPGTAWGTQTDDGADNLWEISQGKYSSHGSYAIFNDHDHVTAYDDTENAPVVATTISNLTPGASYAIRLLFGSHTDVGNQIYGGLSSGSLSLYNSGNSTLETAGTLFFDNGYMNRYEALLGTAVADSMGQIKAYVGSAPDTDANQINTVGRTMYDGLTYQAVPEPGSMLLLTMGLFGLLAYAWRKKS
jgi:hypothetical protein